jgi:hypothetical protein
MSGFQYAELFVWFIVTSMLIRVANQMILQNLTDIDFSSRYWSEFRYSCIYPYWFRFLDVGFWIGPQNEWGYFQYRTAEQKIGMFLFILCIFGLAAIWDLYAVYRLIRYFPVEKRDPKRAFGPWELIRIDPVNMTVEKIYL